MLLFQFVLSRSPHLIPAHQSPHRLLQLARRYVAVEWQLYITALPLLGFAYARSPALGWAVWSAAFVATMVATAAIVIRNNLTLFLDINGSNAALGLSDDVWGKCVIARGLCGCRESRCSWRLCPRRKGRGGVSDVDLRRFSRV